MFSAAVFAVLRRKSGILLFSQDPRVLDQFIEGLANVIEYRRCYAAKSVIEPFEPRVVIWHGARGGCGLASRCVEHGQTEIMIPGVNVGAMLRVCLPLGDSSMERNTGGIGFADDGTEGID